MTSRYVIHIIDNDAISMGIEEDDAWTDTEALNWTYSSLGRDRADMARLYCIYAAGNPGDLLAEIRPPKRGSRAG